MSFSGALEKRQTSEIFLGKTSNSFDKIWQRLLAVDKTKEIFQIH
jgi:hypothetical protein